MKEKCKKHGLNGWQKILAEVTSALISSLYPPKCSISGKLKEMILLEIFLNKAVLPAK